MRSVFLCILLMSLWLTPAYGQQLKEITNSVGMKMVLILPSTFTMGSPIGEIDRTEDETPHSVTISNWYYLGAHEVTQAEYEKVIGKNPSKFKGEKNPVESVSLYDAFAFCRKLSEMPEEKAAGREYGLPTEAEWEYACRATCSTAYFFGDSVESLNEYAWFAEGPAGTTHPVGEKKPNRWGLYDMHGNVCEWCQDWFAPYPSGESTDPLGFSWGSPGVSRGGGWTFGAKFCRTAGRQATNPELRNAQLGFRVAISLPPKQPESASSK